MQRLRSILGFATPPLETRHRASGLNTRFNGGQLTFADYVAQTRDMIGKVRAGASADDLKKNTGKNSRGQCAVRTEAGCRLPARAEKNL